MKGTKSMFVVITEIHSGLVVKQDLCFEKSKLHGKVKVWLEEHRAGQKDEALDHEQHLTDLINDIDNTYAGSIVHVNHALDLTWITPQDKDLYLWVV